MSLAAAKPLTALNAKRPRENFREKGRRYLIEGRVLIHAVTPHGVVAATVRGDSGLWKVTYTNTWECTCPAKSRCSHVEAVSLVVEP